MTSKMKAKTRIWAVEIEGDKKLYIRTPTATGASRKAGRYGKVTWVGSVETQIDPALLWNGKEPI